MSMVAELFSGIKLLSELVMQNQSKRDRLADLIEKISIVIDKISCDLKSNEFMQDSHLHEFLTYCRHFDKIAGKKLNPETKEHIRILLELAKNWDMKNYEKIMTTVIIAKDMRRLKQEDLKDIDKISGELRALANLLKATDRPL